MNAAAAPLIEFAGVVKDYGGASPLRLTGLRISERDRIVLAGLDTAAAETAIHLISGAALPDEGTVRTGGADTREISTDTEWLLSLDRFGIVTARTVLLDGLPAAANLALPMTLSIDPMSDVTRRQVERLADEVGLARERLSIECGRLDPLDRVRLLLGRAIGAAPQLLLLEHPTVALTERSGRAEFGRVLRRVASAHAIGWLAFSDDRDFARATGGERWRVDAGSGAPARERWWR
jgi:predicted ABC-type transport system involved in lysophospholipase L1 biosynthesis ATPase subunit